MALPRPQVSMSSMPLRLSLLGLVLLTARPGLAQSSDADAGRKAKARELAGSIFGGKQTGPGCVALFASNQRFRLVTAESSTPPAPWTRLPAEIKAWRAQHPETRTISVVKAQAGVPRARLEEAAKALTAAGVTPAPLPEGLAFTWSEPEHVAHFMKTQCDLGGSGALNAHAPTQDMIDPDLLRAVQVDCPAVPLTPALYEYLAETCGFLEGPVDVAAQAAQCAENAACAGPCAEEFQHWRQEPMPAEGLRCEAFRDATRKVPAAQASLAVHAWVMKRLSCLVSQATRPHTPMARALSGSCKRALFQRAELTAP
ncbi:hypothetical protein NR798_14915 [Archangium gephyra]|uniref:hypothetical protein n=1 Tax=Archangium gephyra TaxID=48 RepID=UPI0035D4770B